MKTHLTRFARVLAVGSLLLAFAAPASAAFKDSKAISTGLRILNQVVGHTGRLVAAKNYDQVGHEHSEFVEGAEMLREALKGEPTELTAKVLPALDDAVKSSEALGKIAASTKDAAKAEAAHAEFAAKVKTILEMFPEDLRPKPRQKKA